MSGVLTHGTDIVSIPRDRAAKCDGSDLFTGHFDTNPNEGAHEMKIARTHLLARLALVATVSVGLAACGGSSNNNEDETPTPPTPHTVTLPAGHGLTAGTTDIAEGETKTLGSGVTLMCPDGADCVLTVSVAPVTGEITAMSTGGLVVVTAPPVDTGLPGRQAAQRAALDAASTDVITALAGLERSNLTEAQVTGLKMAVDALKAAIDGADDLEKSETGRFEGQHDAAETTYARVKADFDREALAKRRGSQQQAITLASNEVDRLAALLTTALAGSLKDATDEVAALVTANATLRRAIDAADDLEDTSAAEMKHGQTVIAINGANTQINTDRTQRTSAQSEALRKARALVSAATQRLDSAGDDADQGHVTALSEGIEALRKAIGDVDDDTGIGTTEASSELAAAETKLTIARNDVNSRDASEKEKMLAAHRTAIGNAETEVEAKQNALSTPPTQAEVDALETAIKALEGAIADAQGMSDELATELRGANALVSTAKNLHTAKQGEVNAEADRIRVEGNKDSMEVADALTEHTVAGSAPIDPVTVKHRDSVRFTLGGSQSDSYKGATPAATEVDDDWWSQTFTRTGKTGRRDFSETVVVYSDIQQAEDDEWTVDAFNRLPDVTTDFADDAVNTTEDDANENVVTFGSVVVKVGEKGEENVRGSGVLPNEVADGDDQGTRSRFTSGQRKSGSLFGESGAYECSGSDGCTIERSDDDELTFTGTIVFRPSSNKPEVRNVTSDPVYTIFGYWTREVERGETSKHDIETFAGGEGRTTLDGATTPDLHMVDGTATYEGVAGGVYVKKDGPTDSRKITHGDFIADATLEVIFGQNTAQDFAPNELFTISGAISGFEDEDGSSLGFDDLTLEKTAFSHTNTSATFEGVADGTNNGVGTEFIGGETNGGGATGEWSGQFYGDVDRGDNATPAHTDDYPSNVSGQFNGHFTNGHVVGAFGAEYSD